MHILIRNRFVLGRSLLAASLLLGLVGVLLRQGTRPQGTSLSDIYRSKPSFETLSMGYFATGAALVDIDGDTYPDMVLANGNDIAPQSFVVYRNDGKGRFPHAPSWYSGDIDHHGDLAVGDVDGDGALDVATAVMFGHQREIEQGGVKIYFNRGGTLEQLPSYRTGDGYMTASCALGDVDGDGDLDLATAVMFEGKGRFPSDDQRPGQARIYLNRAGRIDPLPAWQTSTRTIGGDLLFADVNQDGWMDLAVTGNRTYVYYGQPAAPETVPLPAAPEWTSASAYEFSFALDVGRVLPGRALSLASASSCLQMGCPSDFMVYQPSRGATAFWRSQRAENAGKLLLADLNGDGFLELVGGQFGPSFMGGPLWIFAGSAAGLSRRPDYISDTASVQEGIAVADVEQRQVVERESQFAIARPGAVLTLPERRIIVIAEVRRNGAVVPSRDYAWTPESNWVSLRQRLEPGDEVSIRYRYSPVADLLVANFNNYTPSVGSYIYRSFLAR